MQNYVQRLVAARKEPSVQRQLFREEFHIFPERLHTDGRRGNRCRDIHDGVGGNTRSKQFRSFFSVNLSQQTRHIREPTEHLIRYFAALLLIYFVQKAPGQPDINQPGGSEKTRREFIRAS